MLIYSTWSVCSKWERWRAKAAIFSFDPPWSPLQSFLTMQPIVVVFFFVRIRRSQWCKSRKGGLVLLITNSLQIVRYVGFFREEETYSALRALGLNSVFYCEETCVGTMDFARFSLLSNHTRAPAFLHSYPSFSHTHTHIYIYISSLWVASVLLWHFLNSHSMEPIYVPFFFK